MEENVIEMITWQKLGNQSHCVSAFKIALTATLAAVNDINQRNKYECNSLCNSIVDLIKLALSKLQNLHVFVYSLNSPIFNHNHNKKVFSLPHVDPKSRFGSFFTCLCESHRQHVINILIEHFVSLSISKKSNEQRKVIGDIIKNLVCCLSKKEKQWLIKECTLMKLMSKFVLEIHGQMKQILALTDKDNRNGDINEQKMEDCHIAFCTVTSVIGTLFVETRSQIEQIKCQTFPVWLYSMSLITHSSLWSDNKYLQGEYPNFVECIAMVLGDSELSAFGDCGSFDQIVVIHKQSVGIFCHVINHIESILASNHLQQCNQFPFTDRNVRILCGVCYHLVMLAHTLNVDLCTNTDHKGLTNQSAVESQRLFIYIVEKMSNQDNLNVFFHKLVLNHFGWSQLKSSSGVQSKSKHNLLDLLILPSKIPRNMRLWWNQDYDNVNELRTPQSLKYRKLNIFEYFPHMQRLYQYCGIFLYTHLIASGFARPSNYLGYGINHFGNSIGYYGVIPLLLSHMYHSFDYDQSKWPSHDNAIDDGNRHMVRFIRTSLIKFANSIGKHDNFGDEQFWKAFSLIMVGKYSLYCSNCTLLKPLNTYTNGNQTREQKILKLENYLSRFVVKPIENGMTILESFKSKYTKYSLNFEFEEEIYAILRFCACVFGDRKKFDLNMRLVDAAIDVPNHVEKVLLCRPLKLDTLCPLITALNEANRSFKFWRRMETLIAKNMKFCRVENESKLTHLNAQFGQWKELVVEEKSQDKELFEKWKNCVCVKFCSCCKKSSMILRKCKGCHKAYYCSKLCQKMDWNYGEHRNYCVQNA